MKRKWRQQKFSGRSFPEFYQHVLLDTMIFHQHWGAYYSQLCFINSDRVIALWLCYFNSADFAVKLRPLLDISINPNWYDLPMFSCWKKHWIQRNVINPSGLIREKTLNWSTNYSVFCWIFLLCFIVFFFLEPHSTSIVTVWNVKLFVGFNLELRSG